MVILDKAPSKFVRSFSARGDPMRIHKHALYTQLRSQYLSYEGLFCLSFNNSVQANQCDGLPPSTFFSHSSESVYCSSQSDSSGSLSLLYVDSLLARSVTTTSCGSQRSMRETDCVATM